MSLDPNMNAALSLGRFLWQESSANLKNLSDVERDKVELLMKNLSKIASKEEKSPITSQEATAILEKLQTAKRIAPKSILSSFAKKITSSCRTTLDDLHKAKNAMTHDIDSNERLRTMLTMKTTMPKEFMSAISDEILRTIHDSKDLADSEQALVLNGCLKDKKHILPADVKANKEAWLNVLKAITTLETQGPKSEAHKQAITGFILAKLAASGSLDEKFATEWRNGKYGNQEQYPQSFNTFIAASFAINGKVDDAQRYLTDLDPRRKETQQISVVLRAKGREEAIAKLKEQVDSWSDTPATA